MLAHRQGQDRECGPRPPSAFPAEAGTQTVSLGPRNHTFNQTGIPEYGSNLGLAKIKHSGGHTP